MRLQHNSLSIFRDIGQHTRILQLIRLAHLRVVRSKQEGRRSIRMLWGNKPMRLAYADYRHFQIGLESLRRFQDSLPQVFDS
jgi:hypothetical protein